MPRPMSHPVTPLCPQLPEPPTPVQPLPPKPTTVPVPPSTPMPTAFPTSISTIDNDRLGKYIAIATSTLQAASSWEQFVLSARSPTDISSSIDTLSHPASRLLANLRNHGAPITMSTPPWSQAQKDHAIQRGNHPSTLAHADFLREEMADMVQQRFWVVVPYQNVRHLSALRLSPMGVVPQRDRWPRPIVDYTFSNINAETTSPAPIEAMQFGHAFNRILYRIHHANPHYGPVYLLKVDLADGFYRVPLASADLLALAVAFPHLPHEPKLVAIPLVLPMGWVASPPYFCSLTETITDVTNHRLTVNNLITATHRLTEIAKNPSNNVPIPPCINQNNPTSLATPPPPRRPPIVARSRSQPLAYVDVYMDDFILISQGHPTRRDAVRSTLFHTIDQVLRPLNDSDTSFHRKEPISVKKLNKGVASWATRKIILGWVVDTHTQTIELPPRRVERLNTILPSLLARRRIAFSTWQKLIGELQSMILALPGGKGLFSTLYTGYLEALQSNRLRITRPIRDALLDLTDLAADLQNRPTRIGELVDTVPAAYGTADASGTGMGGVWLSADPNFPLFLWRTAFTGSVQQRLVTKENPSGSITNSDLELMGQIAAQDLIVQLFDCRERTLALFTDNVSARAWQRKGSCTTLGPAAYLLRLLSLHQRHFRYRSTFDYLPGPLNVMADDVSRRWDLSDDLLLTHFNTAYPQTQPWQLLSLRPTMLSALITALSCKRCNRALFLPDLDPATLPGFDGPTIATHWVSHRYAPNSTIRYHSSKSLPIVTEPAASHPVVKLSDLVPWKGPSALSPRQWPYWGPQTPVLQNTDNRTTDYNNNYVDTTG
jgi:hypothetical protein